MVLYLAGSHPPWPLARPTTAAGGLCTVERKKKTGEGQEHASIDPFMQRRGSVTQHNEHLLEIEKMIGGYGGLFPFSSASLVFKSFDGSRSCRVGTFPFSALTGVNFEMWRYFSL